MAKPHKLKDGTTAKQILDAANAVYPDGFLENYYDAKGDKAKGSGDTMAQFIAIEIIESFGDADGEDMGSVEAIDLIIQRLETAHEDLGNVIGALSAMRDRLS